MTRRYYVHGVTINFRPDTIPTTHKPTRIEKRPKGWNKRQPVKEAHPDWMSRSLDDYN
jgi:hypothetical protein